MPQKKCPNLKVNEEKCPCTATDCERHGVCCECVRYHASTDSLPACCRAAAR